MKQSKTIFISVFHSFISKNILNTDVFKIIREQPGLRIVLIVPLAKKVFFSEKYGSSNVIVEGIDVGLLVNLPWSKRFSWLSHLLMNSFYLQYKKTQSLQKNKTLKGHLKYFFDTSFTWLFAGRKFCHKLLRYGFLRGKSIKNFSELFVKYNPSVIFSTDVFDEMDLLMVREARLLGLPVIGMVRSWDNCYSKGVLRILPDYLIVNNYELKKEAVSMHDMAEDKIFIGGLPQFDASIFEPRADKVSFFKSIGADSSKKLIFFGPAGSILSDTDWQIAEIMRRAIGEKKLPSAQVFVSNHPNHPADFSKFKNDGSFIFASLGKTFSSNPKETELTSDDTKQLRDLLFYADVVIYVASTIGIDSLQFDKPQIVINFDGWEKKNYIDSVKKYHREDHMKKMLDLGGVSVAKSSEQLIDFINAYFSNPTLNHENRMKIIEQQLYKLDGKSGERIGQKILALVEEMAEREI